MGKVERRSFLGLIIRAKNHIIELRREYLTAGEHFTITSEQAKTSSKAKSRTKGKLNLWIVLQYKVGII